MEIISNDNQSFKAIFDDLSLLNGQTTSSEGLELQAKLQEAYQVAQELMEFADETEKGKTETAKMILNNIELGV